MGLPLSQLAPEQGPDDHALVDRPPNLAAQFQRQPSKTSASSWSSTASTRVCQVVPPARR
ncbi:hypothetical protein [Streptomyces solaniscabiei]|uniref:hypothetical protein n=1 Tax=Streptomyces solaniscabiei TaxID=2683255 RepID=UPI001CE29697|nr:hypothetical protein [Streptomyces solaniscabiei]